MRLGVIADDFTGATDIAGFLVGNGLSTVLYSGIPQDMNEIESDAMVVSLKIRSCKVEEAVSQALDALQFLQRAGCTKFYHKYCSTFDSTHEGNIGPVADALMRQLGVSITIVCPSLPINGRTVYLGYLFVGDQLLHESSMREHPVTPMRDSKLSRLMEGQFSGRSGHIFLHDIRQGVSRIKDLISQAETQGINYLIMDTVENGDLECIAEATHPLALVTGGSGLAVGIAHHINRQSGVPNAPVLSFIPSRAPGVIIAGSCSKRTNEQVAYYKSMAASWYVDVGQCMNNPLYAQEMAQWVLSHADDAMAPLIYATKSPEELQESKMRYGDSVVAELIEQTIATLTSLLMTGGVRNFITAGGETSGVVVNALGLDAYLIGPQIDPGVSWIRSLDKTFLLALKSGNFGGVDFFVKAQEMYHE